jgi:hypothetical protein
MNGKLALTGWLLMSVRGIAAGEAPPPAGAPRLEEGVLMRFRDTTQVGREAAEQIAPELAKRSREMQGALDRMKSRSTDALPDFQDDLERITAALASTVNNVTDEKVKARWAEFQKGVLGDLKERAQDEVVAGLFGRLGLDAAQAGQARPIVREHVGRLMAAVEDARKAGLDGVPALAGALAAQVADLDAQLGGILKPEQMAELRAARAALREKVFGRFADRQVADLVAAIGSAAARADQVKSVLLDDVKARMDLLQTAGREGKAAVERLKEKFGAINADTRSRLQGLLSASDLAKLEEATRDRDAKLLQQMAN